MSEDTREHKQQGDPTATRFDRDSAVTPIEDAADGGNEQGACRRYEARIDPGWWIVRGPNGGYLAAIILRACLHAVGEAQRTPRSLTIHYASAPHEGPVEIETRIERRGRSLTTVSARLTQQGKLIAIALTAASSPREDGFELQQIEMPEAIPPEQLPLPGPPRTAFAAHFDQRFLPGAGPRIGADTAVVAAWIRLREGRPLDYPLLAAYTDAFPPACFALDSETSRVGGFPTIDLNIHFHTALPRQGATPDEFSFGIFRTQIGHQGFVAEDGELWSRDGTLLAQSRQLAVVIPSP